MHHSNLGPVWLLVLQYDMMCQHQGLEFPILPFACGWGAGWPSALRKVILESRENFPNLPSFNSNFYNFHPEIHISSQQFPTYPLVMTNIAIEHHHNFYGNIHYFYGQMAISMAIFHSKLWLFTRGYLNHQVLGHGRMTPGLACWVSYVSFTCWAEGVPPMQATGNSRGGWMVFGGSKSEIPKDFFFGFRVVKML